MKTTSPQELRVRTKEFAIKVIRFNRTLPRTEEARVIGRQLLRSATPVGANYRAVCLARSKAEFIAKMGVVLEEADECICWLELLEDAGVLPKGSAIALHREAGELAAIFASSFRTARSGGRSSSTGFNSSIAR